MIAETVKSRVWQITDKGDPLALALVDGVAVGRPPHYSRQTPGSRFFTRNGQNLVFIIPIPGMLAVWVTFRPTPGKAVRADGLDAWECALFRNEGACLSSDLIREAHLLSFAIWGELIPVDGLITFVKPEAVRTDIPGYCYRRAGWRRVGNASDGKPLFRAPRLDGLIPSWREWGWHGERGGKLRRTLWIDTAPAPR